MPTNRITRRRRRIAVSAEAVKAYRAHDYRALHRELGLAPFEMSPLPRYITPLGVDPDQPPLTRTTLFDQSFEQAVALHRKLETLAA